MLDRDAYDILGVDHGSSPDEIRCAFRRAALLHHPDKGGDPLKFNDVKLAYNLLSQKAGTQQQAQADLADILSKGLEKLCESFVKARLKKDLAITLRIGVSLRELYAGDVKKLNVKTYASGVPRNKTFYIPLRGFTRQHVFAGGGDTDAHGNSGDLVVNFDVTGMDDGGFFFDDALLDGHDLFLTVPVDLHAYLTGGERLITLPDGDAVTVAFTPLFDRSCDGAKCVTVKDKGMPFDDDRRGDLLVKLQVDLRPRSYDYADDAGFVEKLRAYFT